MTFEEQAKLNADLKTTNVKSLKKPTFLNVMLGEKDNIIKSVSEPQLIPLKHISASQKNPGREGGVKMKSVKKIYRNLQEGGWRDGSETCVVIKMPNPEQGSNLLYNLYFTLHRFTSSKNIQNDYGITNPVLPSVVVELKDNLSQEEFDRAIVDMADFENEQTSRDNAHEPYSDESKDNNVLEYLATFPNLKTTKDKLSHLKNIWKKKQLGRGMHPNTAAAVIKRLESKIGIVSPMVRFRNDELRKDWQDNDYRGDFTYGGEEIISLDLTNKSLQQPFGDGEEYLVEFWHQPHFNRDFGNLMNTVTNWLENGIHVPILVILDADKAQGAADVNMVRKNRIEQIERHMKFVSQEVKDMVHFVAFVPHLRDSSKEDLGSMISYKKLKEQFFGK